MQKIPVEEKYNSCLSRECIYRKECAQHETAGDYRSEDGLTPILKRINNEIWCETIDSAIEQNEYFGNGTIDFKKISEELTFEI